MFVDQRRIVVEGDPKLLQSNGMLCTMDVPPIRIR